ncbi:SMP-30/gluconolactonase/LRE family protein, partial [Shewanella sp. A25]|nr:SMP-30/gluconolactonase/LRE family protein [Shewanella shenzhenensis]
ISSIELLHELDDALPSNRINDAKCDASGRLWFGTIETNCLKYGNKITPTGKICSYSKREGCRAQAAGIYLSNGIIWDS